MAAGITDHNSRLLRVPLEILQQIIQHLTTSEYGNVRLTCKHLEASLSSAFTREFFMKKQFMLTYFSLQALIDISNSRLADGVKHIIMGIDRPIRRIAPTGFTSINNINHSIASPIEINKFNQQCIDHSALLDGGHDVVMMSQAFANLKNLETIEIRDFRSSRSRDTSKWRSYGAGTFEAETGLSMSNSAHYIPLNLLTEDKDYMKRLFQNLLRALGRTSTRPRRLEVNARTSGLADDSFKIQTYDLPAITSVVARLEDVFLDLQNGSFLTIMAGQGRNSPPIQCQTYHIRIFLSHLHALRRLRLNFQHIRQEHAEDFLEWFSRPLLSPDPSVSTAVQPQDTVPEAPLPLYFRNLQELEIGKVALHAEIFLDLLQKYKENLQSFYLYRVELLDPSPHEVKRNEWARLFKGMARLDLKVKRLVMSFLRQSKECDARAISVGFKDCPNGTRSWKGEHLNGALKEFANNVFLVWPKEMADNRESDSDENSEDSEESEDGE
jgi:hypothetical protein